MLVHILNLLPESYWEVCKVLGDSITTNNRPPRSHQRSYHSIAAESLDQVNDFQASFAGEIIPAHELDQFGTIFGSRPLGGMDPPPPLFRITINYFIVHFGDFFVVTDFTYMQLLQRVLRPACTTSRRPHGPTSRRLTGVASRWQAHDTVSSQLCWYNARPQTGRASAAAPDASHHTRRLLSSRDPLDDCPHHPQYHPQQQQQRHTCACALPTALRPRTEGRTRRGSQLPAAGVSICQLPAAGVSICAHELEGVLAAEANCQLQASGFATRVLVKQVKQVKRVKRAPGSCTSGPAPGKRTSHSPCSISVLVKQVKRVKRGPPPAEKRSSHSPCSISVLVY